MKKSKLTQEQMMLVISCMLELTTLKLKLCMYPQVQEDINKLMEKISNL